MKKISYFKNNLIKNIEISFNSTYIIKGNPLTPKKIISPFIDLQKEFDNEAFNLYCFD